MTDTSLKDQEYFQFHKNTAQLVFLKHTNMLWHFITPKCQQNQAHLQSPICSGQLSIQTPSTEKHFKQDRCTFLKTLLFFLFSFTSYPLVAILLKKTQLFHSIPFSFSRIYKMHYYSKLRDFCWHTRTNRKSVHWTLGERITEDKKQDMLSSLKICSLSRYSLTLPIS